MIVNRENLIELIDLEKWQTLQDSVSEVTGMAIITVDYQGTPISAHSGRQSYCALMRSDMEFHRYCEKCDARGGLEAVRLSKPYMYLCHCGLLDIAIPIIIDGNYLGAVMAGQVILSDADACDLEQICLHTSAMEKAIHTDKFLKEYALLPRMSMKQAETATKMIYELCAYLSSIYNKNLAHFADGSFSNAENIGHSKNSKHVLSGMNTKEMNHLKSVPSSLQGASNMSGIKKESENYAALNDFENGHSSSSHEYDNSIIGPAISYLHHNIGENLSVKNMATMCHISPDYFSRLFIRETNEHFNSYLNRIRIEKAKLLLSASNHTVQVISDMLGFSDASHLVRTFKRYEGITPSRYRSQYIKK
ncbi:MAG: PocR ligand-binding domain-containing protein [Clostridiales Family XIII bacterium]|jgi:ligand-binding sensor protein/AraC-like DNA-binding protein|nr:PocR ligand-binding domain-containing protein [Clostridiales Family XIII bacterium]